MLKELLNEAAGNTIVINADNTEILSIYTTNLDPKAALLAFLENEELTDAFGGDIKAKDGGMVVDVDDSYVFAIQVSKLKIK